MCVKDVKMKKTLIIVFSCCLFSSLSDGQDLARGEVYGGYSYSSVSTSGLTPSRQNYNGWETSFSMNLKHWIGAESDVSSYFQNFDLVAPGTTSSVNLNMRGYDFLVGPRISYRPVFVHALFGIDRLSATAPGLDATQNKFASALGGGVQWYFSRYLGVRISTDYLFTHHNIFGGASALQNNLRAGAGLVYRFGSNSRPEGKAPAARPRPEPQATKVTVARAARPEPATRITATKSAEPIAPEPRVAAVGYVASLGIQTSTAPMGVQLLEVTHGSVAEFAGLHPGDVIDSVDGKPVRTPAELSSALSGHARGDKVKLGYMVNGYWQAETTVTLQ
jgi:hypothetical protein